MWRHLVQDEPWTKEFTGYGWLEHCNSLCTSKCMLTPALKLKYPLKRALLSHPDSVNGSFSLISVSRVLLCSLGAWPEPRKFLCCWRAPFHPLGWSRNLLGCEHLYNYEWMKSAWYCSFFIFFFIIHQEANLAQAPKVMTKISFLFWSLPGSLWYLCWLGELVLSSKGGSSTSHVPRTRPRARKAPLWEHFWPFLNETCCGFEPGIDRGRGTAVMFL